MKIRPVLRADELETYDNAVVPRYLSFFGSLALDMLFPIPEAHVAHIGCRTGYPDAAIADKMPQSSLLGVDASGPAIEFARAKASLWPNVRANYSISETVPTLLAESSFTHALALHPLCDAQGRGELLAELRRVLIPGGQALLALPLRGSFPEINDMVREYALRQDLPDLGKAVDVAAASRPTIETVSEEFETAGLTEVDVDVQLIAVSFNNGREFLEDPIAKLLVLPDATEVLGVDATIAESAMRYVAEAIGKYWSEGVFELTVNVGCASGRRL
ncbi:MAG TPA: methyltransferase domain-containing protein [Minicystis sp.]|nr:methyltransferase domain-containing protein [Minicystis sp.]